MHLLAKFSPRTLYAFAKNEAISPWANSKRSVNTESEMNIPRNEHFQLYYRRIT